MNVRGLKSPMTSDLETKHSAVVNHNDPGITFTVK